MNHQLQIQNPDQKPAQTSNKAMFKGKAIQVLGISQKQYDEARRLIRDNGRAAIKWMEPITAAVMDVLCWGQVKDRLAERADIIAYCKREGIACNPHQTA